MADKKPPEKNEKNIEQFAQQIIDSWDYQTLLEVALADRIAYLEGLNDQEWKDEWEFFNGIDDEEETEE